jgi:hypothetical protein
VMTAEIKRRENCGADLIKDLRTKAFDPQY